MGIINQVLSTLIVCYLCISMGLMFAWPSSTLNIFKSADTTLNRPMSETELALFGSLSSIGALISTPIAGYFLDIIGRKYCAIASSLMHVIAWTLILACNKVEVILVAIFISGIGGAVFLVVPVFVSEICQESIRGAMTSGSMIFYAVGLMLSYLLGGVLSYKTMVYVSLTLAVVGVVLLGFLRESPMFLMKNGSEEEAAKSFAFYRNAKVDSKEVMQEMDTLRRAFNPDLEIGEDATNEEAMLQKPPPKIEITEKLTTWQFIKRSRTTRRAAFVSIVLVTAATLQGLVVVQVYADPLFSEAVPNMSSTLCSVLLALIGIIAGLFAAYLTDLAGRRPLMIYASMGSGLCCVILGTQLQFHWASHWVTALFIYMFCATYTLGAGTVPFVVVAEVFLPEVKSLMSMVVIEWAWLCNFVILFIFNPIVSYIGLGPVFYLFAIICFLSAIFCVFYLPETKGLPIDAIQILFTKKRSQKY